MASINAEEIFQLVTTRSGDAARCCGAWYIFFRRYRAVICKVPSEGCSNPQSTMALKSSGFRRKSLNPDEWIATYFLEYSLLMALFVVKLFVSQLV